MRTQDERYIVLGMLVHVCVCRGTYVRVGAACGEQNLSSIQARRSACVEDPCCFGTHHHPITTLPHTHALSISHAHTSTHTRTHMHARKHASRCAHTSTLRVSHRGRHTKPPRPRHTPFPGPTSPPRAYTLASPHFISGKTRSSPYTRAHTQTNTLSYTQGPTPV